MDILMSIVISFVSGVVVSYYYHRVRMRYIEKRLKEIEKGIADSIELLELLKII